MSNWLPAPKDDFSLYVRAYWPQAETSGTGANYCHLAPAAELLAARIVQLGIDSTKVEVVRFDAEPFTHKPFQRADRDRCVKRSTPAFCLAGRGTNPTPHGMTDRDFEAVFTPDKPVVFTFHGYPGLIHRLTYRRSSQRNLHVRGYKEHGNINTPLELAIRNQTDRFSLAIDAIDRMPRFPCHGIQCS
jgi:hypothetical protein